ncbi:MAG: TonB-dependent hemoglobin/transferrin/lactoferrin family receptor [Hyphomicrobium sp.]
MFRKTLFGTVVAGALLTAATQATLADEIQLDGIVVTFSKVAESAIDTLAGSSAIGRSQIDEQYQADRVGDFIDSIPGVVTQENNRDTAQAINVRGLQDFGRVNVLVEGARQNFQRSGHNANGVFYLDPEMIKRVDVTRGPTSVVYGSGAIGGVVAFELLDADDILREGEYAAVRTRTSYGTNGDGRLGSGTAAVRVGNFDIVAQANFRESNDYEDGDGNVIVNTGEENQANLVKARWRPADGHQITTSIVDYQSEFVDRLGAAVRDTDVENRQYTLGYTFAQPDSPLVDFSAKIYRNETDLDQIRLSNSRFEPAGSERFFGIVTEGLDVFNTSRFDFANVKAALTYGGDVFRDRVTTSDPIGNGDEFTPSGERTVGGAFLQSQFTFFDIVDLITALRYDTYELDGGDVKLDGDRVSPKVTLGVTPIAGMTLFATYAEGYRAPAVTETLIDGIHPPPAAFPLRPNPNLDPEVAHNIEGGVNLKYNGVATVNDAFRAKAVVFRNKVDDYIDGVSVFDPTSPLGFAFQYQNIANVTLEGVEVEATYDARIWFVSIGASRVRGEDDATGIGLLSIPADQATFTLGVRAFEEKLVAGVRARFVADQDRIPAGTPPGEAYTLVDLFAEYEATDNATLNFNVNNLFDETYIQYRDSLNSPGFNARFGLTMRFGAH